MIIKDFTNMDRVGNSLKTLTRLLVNAKLVGSLGQRKIKKLPGYEDFITSLAISGGGTLTPHENAVFFKDPNHGYATSQTLFMIDSNTLYYYDSVNGFVAVSWDGSGSADFTPVADARFWFERGTLHIAAGLNGTASVYRYIDRQIANEEGYFEDAEEHNAFWFGEEELPDFDTSQFTISTVQAKIETAGDDYDDALPEGLDHHVLGVYSCEGGELAIPKIDGMTSFKHGGASGSQNSFVAQIKIAVSQSDFDKRLTGIDLYGSVQVDTQEHQGRKYRQTTGSAEFESFEWNLLKRIDINQPNIIWTGAGYITGGPLTEIYFFAPEGGLAFFPNDSLNDKFYIQYKAAYDDAWSEALITDCVWFDNSGLNIGKITVGDTVFSESTYLIRVVSKWALSSGNYEIYHLWRFIGEGDTVDERGDPIEEAQPYSTIKEYYPKYQFAAVQDRRTYRLGVTTDEEHKNMILWSEIDTPDVVPNGNLVFLNTSNDEEPKGLEWVNNGLLALFEKSAHFIRMTGEPVTYDSEEGKFKDGCIASRSVINANGLAFWFGLHGIKMYVNGEVKDITHDFLKDDYEALIASEYAGNSSSYEGIVGTYNPKERLVIWSLPNSTASISSVAVDCIAYDLETGGFILLESEKDFIGLVTNYDGVTYGIATDGIYELFGGSPDENTQMIWESGIFLADDLDDLAIERLRLRYNGAFTVKLYTNGTNAVMNLLFPTLTSIANRTAPVGAKGEDYYIRLESTSDAGVDDEIEMIDLKLTRLPK